VLDRAAAPADVTTGIDLLIKWRKKGKTAKQVSIMPPC
jgi:hypothetical protein